MIENADFPLMIAKNDRNERMPPKLPADPIERMDPAEPIERIEPVDPIERIEPVDPIDRRDPREEWCGRRMFHLDPQPE